MNRPFVFLDEPFAQIEPLYIELMSHAIRNRTERSAFLVTDHSYWSVREVSTRLRGRHAILCSAAGESMLGETCNTSGRPAGGQEVGS